MAKIYFTEGSLDATELDLPEEDLVIGRGPECNLILEDAGISTTHAKLSLEDGAWILTDLDSSNGTHVNDEEISTTVLKHGDEVFVGATAFLFSEDNSSREAVVKAATGGTAPAAKATPPAPAKQAPAPKPTPRSQPAPTPRPQTATGDHLALVEEMKQRTEAIRAEVGKVIVGQTDVLDQVLMCILARGHALLIGLPGMAKTLMVQTISQVLDMGFKRIQFTPDLMPMDIIGTDVLETDQSTGEKNFRFVKGPIFTNMLLADEINRTPPKTQAALLEAMQEKRVTAGNETFKLDAPFLVLATQNPIEQEGTYPLPEAQLDRFMFNIWVDYPTEEEEEKIVGSTTTGDRVEPQCVLTKEEVLALQDTVSRIPVSEHVVKYAIRLVRATRPQNEKAPEITKKFVSTGAGPRAGQNLILAAKSMAVLEGRIHVSCADIRRAATPVLRHRLITNFAADSEGMGSVDIVAKLIEEVEEPGEESYQ
jgi:MoxR-like ATPase